MNLHPELIEKKTRTRTSRKKIRDPLMDATLKKVGLSIGVRRKNYPHVD